MIGWWREREIARLIQRQEKLFERWRSLTTLYVEQSHQPKFKQELPLELLLQLWRDVGKIYHLRGLEQVSTKESRRQWKVVRYLEGQEQQKLWARLQHQLEQLRGQNSEASRSEPPTKYREIAKPPGMHLGSALRFVFGETAYARNFLQICADGSEAWQEAEVAKRHREVLMIRFRTNLTLLYAALSIIGNKLNSLLNPFYQIGKKIPPGDRESRKNKSAS